jgi:nucleotide-binding universal stress UspA family protein
VARQALPVCDRHALVVDRGGTVVVSTPTTDPVSDGTRIVVGVDGSPHSEEALRWALGQARLTGRPVDAVRAWRIPVGYGVEAGGPLLLHDWEGHAAGSLRDTVASVVEPADVDRVSQRVVKGHPAAVLLDAAVDAALLVVGNRGRGGSTGMLLGSVSRHVIARATCPVVVIRPPETVPR